MCPMLSLANRAFLALLGTLLAFTSLPAQAEDLQFDLTGTAETSTNGSLVGPIDISFVLDTSRSTSSFLFLSNSCLQRFGGVAALSNINVTLNGQLAASMSSASGPYGGDNTNGSCPGAFFSALGTPIFGWEFDASPGTSQAVLAASSDPLATLFLNFQSYASLGRFDGLNLAFDHVTVTPVSVPEPDTLGLLVLGFAGVVLCGRKRISVRAPD